MSVRADLHYTIGLVYSSHGDYESYLQHIRQSLELYREALGNQHPKVARGLYYLSMAENGSGASVEESELMVREGIAMMRQTDPDNINLPYMLQQLAHWIMLREKQSRNESRLAEAERLILESKVLFIRHYGENHGSTLSADGSLARLAMTRGELERAEGLWEENIRRYREIPDGSNGHVRVLVHLAENKLAIGKRTEGESLFREALNLGRSLWGTSDIRFENLVKGINEVRAASLKPKPLRRANLGG